MKVLSTSVPAVVLCHAWHHAQSEICGKVVVIFKYVIKLTIVFILSVTDVTILILIIWHVMFSSTISSQLSEMPLHV